ncbi:MAG: preprotein translocase subunit SecG [Pseudomonadota bacterium]|jgi:preprotein translocase subunit SecG
MYTFVLALHVILAVILVGLVLLQQGKGADIGAVMGGGSNSLFGVGGASSVLVRTTTLIAICFMLTSVLLVRLAATGGSVTGSRSDITEGLNLEALGVKAVDPQGSSQQAAPQAAEPQAAAPQAVVPSAVAAGVPEGAGGPAGQVPAEQARAQ